MAPQFLLKYAVNKKRRKTMNKKHRALKGGIARLAVWALLLHVVAGSAEAATRSIPVDFDVSTVLIAKSAQVDTANTFLVNWRFGPITTPVGNMTFQYLTGSGRAYPTRSSVADHTANDQGDLWSDDAL